MKKSNPIASIIFVILILIVNVIFFLNGKGEHSGLAWLFGEEQPWTDGTFIFYVLREYWNLFYIYAFINGVLLLQSLWLVFVDKKRQYFGFLLFSVFTACIVILPILTGLFSQQTFTPWIGLSLAILFLWVPSQFTWVVVLYGLFVLFSIYFYFRKTKALQNADGN